VVVPPVLISAAATQHTGRGAREHQPGVQPQLGKFYSAKLHDMTFSFFFPFFFFSLPAQWKPRRSACRLRGIYTRLLSLPSAIVPVVQQTDHEIAAQQLWRSDPALQDRCQMWKRPSLFGD
jgi:hypothetical protein